MEHGRVVGVGVPDLDRHQRIAFKRDAADRDHRRRGQILVGFSTGAVDQALALAARTTTL